MNLSFTAVSHDVNMPATTSLANVSTITSAAWVNFNAYTTAWRMWQKGYVGRDGFAHYLGGGTTAFEYQYNRVTSGVNFSANYTHFASWGASKWLFLCVASDGGSNTKLYCGDLNTPPSEPSAYATSTTGSGAYKDDSAIPLDWGNRGGGATNLNGLLNGGIWIPAVLDKIDIIQLWDTPPDLWRQRYRGRSSGIWCFGANGRGLVIDESGNNNHGTITGATPLDLALPRAWGHEGF